MTVLADLGSAPEGKEFRLAFSALSDRVGRTGENGHECVLRLQATGMGGVQIEAIVLR